MYSKMMQDVQLAHSSQFLAGLNHESEFLHALQLLAKVPGERQRVEQVTNYLHGIKGESYQADCQTLLRRLIPVAQLVPDNYKEWRPVVSHGFDYLARNLQPERLLPKLLKQLMLDEATSVQQRLACFIEKIPSLQKLGQILARNPHISTELREQLILLENEIHDCSFAEIEQVLHTELGGALEDAQVHLASELFAEASVSAVIRFCWVDEFQQTISNGVFKVQKPYIAQYVREETELLLGLADYLNEISDEHILRAVDLAGLFNDISCLLLKEIDFYQEQAALLAAATKYSDNRSVRTPQLIEQLCTENVTAMTLLTGVKVTEAFPGNVLERSKLTRKLVNTLLIEPMLDKEKLSLLHADPHAGNLLVNEQSGQLGLLDWAMTDYPTLEDRRHCVMLFCGVFLHDRLMIHRSLKPLLEGTGDVSQDADFIDLISEHCRTGEWLRPAGINTLMDLLDAGLRRGFRYRRGLVVFRKVLLTMQGVLNDISPSHSMDVSLMSYISVTLMSRLSGMNTLRDSEFKACLPINSSDGLALACSLQTWGLRQGISFGTALLSGVGLSKFKTF